MDEQRLGQEAQLRAERENADAYGDAARVAQIDRRLTDLGAAAQKRSEAAAKEAKPEEPKRYPAPQGRTGRPRQHG